MSLETQLITINSNSSSTINNNNSSSSGGGTTGNNNNNSNDHSNSIRRIGDDSTLYDLISSDRSLVMFLMVLGMYIDDGNTSYAVKILARICLLVFGGIGLIGFCWLTFIDGGHAIVDLYDVLTSSSSKSIGVFIELGNVLTYFIVSLVQVTSLMYSITNVYKHMSQCCYRITTTSIMQEKCCCVLHMHGATSDYYQTYWYDS